MRSFTRTLRENRGGPSPGAKTPPGLGSRRRRSQESSRSKASPDISTAAVAGKLREVEGLCVGCTKAAQAPVLSRPSRGDQPGARASARLRSRHGHCG
jgi:hypothetical protein